MKSPYFFIALALAIVPLSNGQDAKGIKTRNLQGADLALMNDHDPASELANFDLLPGYQANLFAADPMLANPVHMHWDSRGRLWVACSWSYPQIKPGDVADDKIIILEDTDNDGAADKSTVFAEGLYLPTGIELANGGCYVGQSPDVFFLKDTDGDDVADLKELALTGFGIEDSHHSISAWKRGPGGWIYFQEGIFLHSQIETQYGVLRNFNGGVYQFNPRTQELRMFVSATGGNPWGHVFDRWGQSFMVNNPRIMYLSPASGNSGEAVPVSTLISTDKQCGGDLATGTHIGDDLRGQLLTGRFKSRMVVRYEFIENGAGFSANVLAPLIRSKHPNFRPVDVKTGPDGAIYVADWYNSIINHAQHDFRDPRRDHDHGRIWRITHKQRPLAEKPQLDGISIAALVDHLKSPQTWTRHQARKELSERDPDKVQKSLESWVERLAPDLPEYDHHLVEAMWACQNVEQVSEKILNRVINAKDGQARSAGARILRYWHKELTDPIALVAKLASDDFPRTRMEAVLSAGFIPEAKAYAAALHATDHPIDSEIDKALSQTTKALASYIGPAMASGEIKFAKKSHQAYAEQGAGIGFEKRLADFLKNPSPEGREIAAVKQHLLAHTTSAEMTMLVNALSGKAGFKSVEATAAMLEVLTSKVGSLNSKAVKRRLPRLIRLLDHDDEMIVRLAAETLGTCKVSQAAPRLISLLEDGKQSAQLRQAAAVGLAGLGDTASIQKLSALTSADHDVATRYVALQGLVRVNLVQGIEALTSLFSVDPGEVDPVPALQSILSNRKGRNLLSTGLKSAKLHPAVVAKVDEFHRTTGQLPKALLPFFKQPSGSNASLSAELLAENQKSLTADVVKLGDPHRGEMVYRQKSLACASCHAIGSAGPSIGPNLVAVGAAASPSYMVESILKPNAAIAEHYETRMFTRRDGSVQLGVVTFKSKKVVIVRDSAQAGKEIRIPIDSIQREQAMPSLMPSGLADQLKSRQEFLDLANFMSVLGRPGDFANDESPVIRKWRVIAGSDTPPSETAAWLPAYSKVDGTLPPADMPDGNAVFVRGYVNVQVAGSVRLQLNATDGLELWIDGKQIEDPTSSLALSLGRRAFTFRIDRKARPNDPGLRIELKTPPGSQIKFQPEGGQ
ncbi:MAG: putative heme-binding domain-containing protein [Verrucomicrobiales bacterium]|jgi:putative heme-binding domain-containing protein